PITPSKNKTSSVIGTSKNVIGERHHLDLGVGIVRSARTAWYPQHGEVGRDASQDLVVTLLHTKKIFFGVCRRHLSDVNVEDDEAFERPALFDVGQVRHLVLLLLQIGNLFTI